MALVLAVEPDPHQAANLARVLEARPMTELVIADSAVRALASLADRVPDVLLTSPLLSRQDELALAGWLRDLGAAAAHVQELTIPILAAAPAAPKKKRSVLGTLRREASRNAKPDGCEPDVFAEQISVYAERAAAGRKYEAAPTPEPQPEPQPELRLEVRAEPTPEPAIEEDDERLCLLLRPPSLWELARMSIPPYTPTLVFKDRWTLPLNFDAIAEEREEPEPWVPVDLEVLAEPAEAAKPPRDEWGLFDPQQCGFTALLARLDEITEQKGRHAQTAETTVRVLAY